VCVRLQYRTPPLEETLLTFISDALVVFTQQVPKPEFTEFYTTQMKKKIRLYRNLTFGYVLKQVETVRRMRFV